MQLFQIALFNEYIISPKTWIHNLKHSIKIFFIFTNLSLVPYINHFYISVFIIFIITIILTLKIPKQYFLNQINILFILLFFFLYKNDMNRKTAYKTCILIPIRIKKTYIFNKILARFINLNQITNKNYVLLIPEFMLRGILISLLYLVSLKLLCLTTKYEHIILFCLINYVQNKNTLMKRIALIISLASQFLILVINKVNITIITIKLRNQKKIFAENSFNAYYYIIIELLLLIHSDIGRVSSALYCREINDNNFLITDIYA